MHGSQLWELAKGLFKREFYGLYNTGVAHSVLVSAAICDNVKKFATMRKFSKKWKDENLHFVETVQVVDEAVALAEKVEAVTMSKSKPELMDEDEVDEEGTFKKASDDVLKNRRIVLLKRK